MGEEKKICLTLDEVRVLKEWFMLVVYHSDVEERDRNLVDKLSNFEKETIENK